jgi:DNA modification methylase
MISYRPVERATLIHGDSLECLRTLPDESVHCCVTSPPYYRLRDYGVDGQIGLERTPSEFIAKLVEVFRDVQRVLRHDGTLWLNIGDSYAGSWGAQSREYAGKHAPSVSAISANQVKAASRKESRTGAIPEGSKLKRKDLIGIPWMLAFALRDDGWYLRQDLIWHKPSAMPSSVTDRCTTAHEYLFLFSKQPRYYYDAVAIQEPAKTGHKGSRFDTGKTRAAKRNQVQIGERADSEFRNKRSVWTISTEPSKFKHFATFPKKLVRPCILAGTSEYGVCSECLAPWKRCVSRKKVKRSRPNSITKRCGDEGTGNFCPNDVAGVKTETTGWMPTCGCDSGVVTATVIDPFSGMGTTGIVALSEGRSYIGAELSREYIEASCERFTEFVGDR